MKILEEVLAITLATLFIYFLIDPSGLGELGAKFVEGLNR